MLKIVVFSALGILVSILIGAWLITRIRYRIGSRHVKVVLFGIPLRRIALARIDSVSKRRGGGLAEYWWSTLRPKHRILVLRRQRGLIRDVVITPKNRYVFKTDLERALQRVARKTAGAQAPPPPSVQAEEDAPGAASPAGERSSTSV